MSRITDFEDAVNAAVIAINDALDGTGDITKSTRIALDKVILVQSELGLGDTPSEDPITLTDPLAV